MDWMQSLALAFALLLILEGLLPLFAPRLWKQMFAQLLQLREGQLLFCGLLCIAAGLLVLIWL